MEIYEPTIYIYGYYSDPDKDDSYVNLNNNPKKLNISREKYMEDATLHRAIYFLPEEEKSNKENSTIDISIKDNPDKIFVPIRDMNIDFSLYDKIISQGLNK